MIPIIVPFFQNYGLTMKEVFQVQAVFGITVVALEIPTGYICDLWGRKRSLLIGTFISGIGFNYLFLAKTFWQFVIFEIIIAIALSLVSGADVSLLYDSVEDDDRTRSTKALANMQFASVSGEAVASILGGILVTFSFQHALIANAISGWIPFFIALSLKESKYEKMSHHSHYKNFTGVLSHIFRTHDRILYLSFVNLVIWGLSTFFAVWMLQKYWEDNGVPLSYFGFLWAGLNLLVGVVGKQVHSFEKRFGALPLLVVMGLTPIAAYVGMGLTGGLLGVSLCSLFYICRGINHVLLRDALNWRTPAGYRATVNSLQSFLFRLGFAIFGPLVGYIIDTFGMNTALVGLGGAFAILFAVVLLPLIKEIKRAALEEIPVRNEST